MHAVNLNTVAESCVQYVAVSLQMLFCGHDQDSQRDSKSNQRSKLQVYRLPWVAWHRRLLKAISRIDSAKLCGWLIMKLEIHKRGRKILPRVPRLPQRLQAIRLKAGVKNKQPTDNLSAAEHFFPNTWDQRWVKGVPIFSLLSTNTEFPSLLHWMTLSSSDLLNFGHV